MRHLFETFGNPVAVAKAIADATPNTEKVKEAISLRERTQTELAKSKEGLQRILNLVVRGTITDKDAELRLTKQKEKIQSLETQLERLEDQLANIPVKKRFDPSSEKIAGKFQVVCNCRKFFRKFNVRTGHSRK